MAVTRQHPVRPAEVDHGQVHPRPGQAHQVRHPADLARPPATAAAPAADDPRAVAVMDYLRWCNEQQRLDTRITLRDGDFVAELG